MKKFRIVLIIALCLVICAMLVACGEDNIVKDPYAYELQEMKPMAKQDPNNEYDWPIVQRREYTVNDDFNYEQIVVSLSNSESLNNLFHDYVPEDFGIKGILIIEERWKQELENFRRQYYNGWTSSGKTVDPEGNYIERPKFFSRALIVGLSEPSKEEAIRIMDEFCELDGVVSSDQYVEHSAGVGWMATSSDTRIGEQWGLEKIDAFGAWDTTRGSSNVKVGVIDTGIYRDHPDLYPNVDTTVGRGSSYSSDPFYANSTQYHGTLVAGVIGAVGNNGLGVSGVCQNVSLVSLRADGLTRDSDGIYLEDADEVIAAIKYATSENIPILNFSGGFTLNGNGGAVIDTVQVEKLKKAIDAYSGLLVVGAGNNNANLDNFDLYPQVLDCDNMIVVGGSNRNDGLWVSGSYGTNYSSTKVDLFAPSVDILTTLPYDEYMSVDGTSLASPFVAGVAALVLSKHPSLNAMEIKKFILDNVDSVSAFSGKCVTGGRLNAKKAVEAAHIHTKLNCTYKNLGFSSGHMVTCTVCDFSEQQAHNWVAINSSSTSAVQYYRCFECGAKSDFMAIPNPYALGQDIATFIDNAEAEMDGDFVIELTPHIAIVKRNGAYYLWYECDENGRPTFDVGEIAESKWGSVLKDVVLQLFGFTDKLV